MKFVLNINNKYRARVDCLRVRGIDLNENTLKYISEHPDKTYFYDQRDPRKSNDDSYKRLKRALPEDKEVPILRETNFAYDGESLLSSGFPTFVSGALGFDLTQLEKINRDIPLWVCPNANRAKYLEPNFFYITPSHLEDYEDAFTYVDFLEDDLIREATLYRIYAIEKKWTGHLKELLPQLSQDVKEDMLYPDTFIRRQSCRQRCILYNTCSYCQTAFRLGQLMEEQLKKEKK